MNEMIERVAEAIYENGGGDALFLTRECYLPLWREIDPIFKDIFFEMARAAIEAMREPTDKMLDAGYAVSHPIDGAVAYAIVAEIWCAMNAAALND